MKKVDWAYVRRACKTCERALEFLEAAKIEPKQRADAKKDPIQAQDALDVLKGCSELHATKGRAVIHVKLGKSAPDATVLRSLLVGPTGKLRAPTLRSGTRLVVGFDTAMYETLFLESKK